ncbi:hypothetical protein SAMN04489735_11031, partial [Aneurinibacillus thermoaerophilus]
YRKNASEEAGREGSVTDAKSSGVIGAANG